MGKNEATAVLVKNVSKSFKIPLDKSSGLKQLIVNFYKRRKGYREFKALKDISFEVKKGEFFGIVGRNGSGKSTLLKILAGTYVPDAGATQVNGSLIPFIELGVGFNPELTGRENVFLNGALLGFSKKEMEAMYDEIVDFAELHEFMEERLKNYSSGMQVRLAFSIAVRAKSDILLLDEVLAVGDAIFQKKCYDYFKQLKKEKKTVMFVSHDISALQEYCDRGILIEKGKFLYQGKIEKVINKYLQILTREEENYNAKTETRKTSTHVGTGEIKIEKTKVYHSPNSTQTIFTEKENNINVEVTYKAYKDIEEPVYGITIFDASGQRMFVTNNLWINKPVPAIKKGQKITVSWKVPNIFNSGKFSLTPAVAGSAGLVTYDQVEEAATFHVRKKTISNAYTNVPHDMIIGNSVEK